MKKTIIGVDIGGTKVMTGLIQVSGIFPGQVRLLRTIEEPTQTQGHETVKAQLARLIEGLAGPKLAGVQGIGVGVPGPLDREKGCLLKAPNLPGWERLPIGAWLERRFKRPVAVENDANAAALSEALWGAGRNKRFVFYATISTGIGTGFVIDKKLFTGYTGLALEGGHLTIDFNGRLCKCGQRGCIEAYASGPSMVRRALETWPSLPKNLDAAMIGIRARSGDRRLQTFIDETARYIGLWLANIVNMLDPDIMILGGGVANLGRPFFDVIRRTIPRHSINPQASRIPVAPAKLGRETGVLGAAAAYLTN